MFRLIGKAALIGLALVSAGCTDAESRWKGAYDKQFHITTKSGGVVDGEYISTGTFHTVENSDGWYFVDAATGKLQVLSGNVSLRELSSDEVPELQGLVKRRNAQRDIQMNQRLGIDNIK